MNLTKVKAKALKDFPVHMENPFLKDLRIPITPKAHMFVTHNKAVVSLSTGEIDNDIIITGKRKYVDAEDFVKVYTKELKSLFDLTKATQKLLSYMLAKIGYDDKVIFNVPEYQKELNYSKPTIFKSLKELLTKGFLSRHVGPIYWINPKLFYKGDRLVIMREYNKAKQQEDTTNRDQLSLFSEQETQHKLIEKELEEIDG